MAQVEMYTIQYCPFCTSAKTLLDQKGVTYTNHDLSDVSDSQRRTQLTELCGRTTVPQIWINGKHIGGCTDLEALEYKGELDRLLAEG